MPFLNIYVIITALISLLCYCSYYSKPNNGIDIIIITELMSLIISGNYKINP